MLSSKYFIVQVNEQISGVLEALVQTKKTGILVSSQSFE